VATFRQVASSSNNRKLGCYLISIVAAFRTPKIIKVFILNCEE